MEVKQLYLGCLAQASTIVGSEGKPASSSPPRHRGLSGRGAGARLDHPARCRDARPRRFRLRPSGAAATGATIHVSRAAGAGYPHDPVAEGAEIPVGDAPPARPRHARTPPDSICLLLYGPGADSPRRSSPGTRSSSATSAVPIWRARSGERAPVPWRLPRSRLARSTTRSIGSSCRFRIPVVVYPGHGAGSMCGRNLSSETVSTIGEQRRTNYALQPMSRDSFVAMMTTDLPEIPAYFGRDVQANREGPALLSEIAPPKSPGPGAVAERRDTGSVVLDTRTSAAFGAGHVPGSIHIGLDGQFASWAGTILAPRRLSSSWPKARTGSRKRARDWRASVPRTSSVISTGNRGLERAGFLARADRSRSRSTSSPRVSRRGVVA